MDPAVIELFGFDPAQLALYTGLIYLLVEGVKNKFPEVFIGGWKTQIVSLIITVFMVWLSTVNPEELPIWSKIAVVSAVIWIGGAGAFSAIKKKGQ